MKENKFTLRKPIVLTKPVLVNLPYTYGDRQDTSLLFEKGAVGTCDGIYSEGKVIKRITVGFEIKNGIKIRIDVKPQDIKNMV